MKDNWAILKFSTQAIPRSHYWVNEHGVFTSLCGTFNSESKDTVEEMSSAIKCCNCEKKLLMHVKEEAGPENIYQLEAQPETTHIREVSLWDIRFV